MKNIKILGTGCARCRATEALVKAVAQDKRVEITLEKVDSLPEIIKHGVLSTPGVVIDGRVVHAGGVPTRSEVEGWF